jgi:peptidoglycan/LPS O-acetylase OafA/YrhL
MKKQIGRISILDSFRALAILAVLFYHYFTRWTFPKNNVSLYPYNDAYNYFEYGHLGVEFFFIISGFVIFFTLEKTPKFILFWKKRFIRLVPPILVASVITYIILLVLDSSQIFIESHALKNFIPSVFFISPQLLNTLTGSNDWGYIDGSYWSLWPEVQFYFLSSTIYFMNKERFVRNYMVISLLLILFNSAIKFLEAKHGFNILSDDFFYFLDLIIDKGFNILNYLAFFSLGFVFYIFYKKHQEEVATTIYEKLYFGFLVAFVLLIHGGLDEHLIIRVFYGFMIMLFLVFIYYPKYLRIFENKFLIRVGLSSYFLYLIHQNIGVVMINTFGQNFNHFGFVLPLIITIILIFISLYYSEKIDIKIGRWLKSKILG